ncbi:protein TASOR 2 isoform X3 [Pseudophryne corroboree]|uniref:protein TASOR 2 isoform X3 n=1 Tax=Pseudophryne corroboree TaxID=495146 RepID=UPI0030821EAA
MSVLQDIDMVQMTSPELYNVWKGQMHIQEQLVCDIALQSSSNCCIPAQLPYKLEIKEVIRLSELRKNLPDHIFHNTDSTGQEVCCERVYSSLYSVITTNVIGLELDKLLQLLKDHDLAVIKVLNDQGFLILVASSALKNHKGVGESDSSQLNALFLFPHTKLLAERGREECKFIRDDISLQISNLLPGLQYAYMETSQMRKNKNIYPDTLMERFFRKYAFLQRESQSPPEVVIEQSDSPSLFHGHESDITEKCGQLAYARLQFYFSSPVNFSVTLKKVSTLLSETAVSSNSDKYAKSGGHLVGHDPVASEAKLPLAVEAKVGSESPHGSNALQSIAKSSKKTPLKRSGRRRGKRGKRKLVHQTAPSSTETGENQTSNKRRKLLSEDQKQVGSSSKTTVKLTIDPYPQRRKRGAEILTAAFVQDEKIKTSQKIVLSKRIEEFRSTTPKSKVVKRRPRKILAPEDSFRVPDRPPKRKASEPGKRNELKNKSESYKKPVERHREKIGRPFKKLEKVKNVATEQIDRFSKPNVDLGLDAKKTSLFTPSPDDSMIEKRINMYESDALNLLADLALNSFCSENPYYIQGECVAHKDESETKEKADSGDNICPVEHPPKDCKHSILPSSASKEPEQILEAEKDKPKDGSNANQGNITSQRHIEYSEKQTPQKFSVAAAKAKARSNTTSKISLEHSYSQLPLDDISDIIFSKEKNEQPVQSIVEPTVTTPTTEVVVEKSPKVFLPAKILFVASEKLSLPVVKVKPRTVTKLEDKFVITFNWDAKYDFDLDSKFTSDPLEKTINRALHGEWNHHLKEKVEDVKIILHMWLALFYSKPNKQLNCSSRKVVEHSNPAKYVSINTVLDPFELYEIVESDAIELCAADTENSNAVVGRKIETSSQGKMQESSLLHKLEKNQNKTRPEDLSIEYSIPTKVLGSIQSQAKECEKYRKVDESEHLTTSDVVSQNIMQQKALELTESTASSVVIDLDCLSNSSQVDKVGSAQSVNTTPEDLLERVSEHSSDKLGDSESKENSKLITNGVHEITDVLTVYSGYSQENEHSYVSKVTAEGTKKPELRITTVKTSYAEHTDTTDLKSSECENVDETGKGSPESTPEQTYNREEQTTSTTVENSVLTLHNDNASIPEKIDGVEEREQVMAVPAQSTLLSSVLCVENTNSLSVASADTGTKVVKAMNSNVIDTNHLLSGHMEEKSSKICGEVTFGKDKPLIGHEEMPLVITNHSVIESVNSEGNSDTLAMDVSALGEKHDLQSDIHSKELSERSSPLILHPSPDNKSIENNISLAGALSERNNLPGTVVEEMHVHTLLENIETLNSCDMVVQSSETLDICEEITLKNKTHTVAGNSELSNSNVTILESDRLSLSSDPLVSKCSAIEVEQLPVETQQNDIPSDALHVSHPLQVTETVPKDLAHSSKNANNNRREILSKLKLICLGSVVGQQAHSISEDDVLLVYEKIGRVSTEEHNQTVDPKNIGGNVQIHDGNTSTPDNTGIMEEDTVSDKAAAVEDHLLPEIPNTTLTGEPGPLEKLVAIPAQNSCISPSTDDFTANTEKDLDQEKSDICFIVNTGSISKEQYDRWSETSDEDIEFIQAYKEPLSHQENLSFQKERHELSSSFEKLTFDHDPTQSKKPKYFKGQSCPSTMLYEADDDPSNGNHGNVIVTKSISDNGKTLHTAHRESRHTGMCNLDNLFSNRRMVSDNITQNTLDLEHLRFMCKLKAVLRKSTAEKHVCEPPFQTMFESKRIPGCSSSTAKNRSPLVITVHCPHRRRDLERLDRRYPSQPYYNDEIWNRPVCYSRTTKKVRTRRSSPFHFSRLRYESTPQKSNSDIAVILKECVQSNHLKLSSVGLGNSAVDRTSASQLAEETGCQARRTSVPFSKSHPVKNIISELCQSLHSRLRSVGRETRKENIYFYICETSDDTFFSSTKSLMTKDGHTQTEPQGFCRGEHTESSMLLVIIRNEDISSTINKIPCLLQLRLLPNVTFAGVDAPEDITESTYQELFQAGGFVVSDKTVLENITLGKLKELLTVMEKMNRTSAWKWLIHYRENRKLKDDKRVESVSQIKTSLLKSYYQSNIIEILPYHQCDKLSNEVSDDLACLLSVQSQRIHSRLAVYLTDTPCTMAEEFEQNGILVYDVDTFIRKIQKVDAQLQASCWS